MIRAVLLIALLVAGASLLGLAIAQGSGYVLIAYQGLRYESSLWLFLALLLVLWLGWYSVAQPALGCSAYPVRWSIPGRAAIARRRGRKASEHGWLELAEGRWQPALHPFAPGGRTGPAAADVLPRRGARGESPGRV